MRASGGDEEPVAEEPRHRKKKKRLRKKKKRSVSDADAIADAPAENKAVPTYGSCSDGSSGANDVDAASATPPLPATVSFFINLLWYSFS